jgi:hypothetical protein
LLRSREGEPAEELPFYTLCYPSTELWPPVVTINNMFNLEIDYTFEGG